MRFAPDLNGQMDHPRYQKVGGGGGKVNRIILDREIALAVAMDKGNANMRKNARRKWSAEDYCVAAQTYERIWPPEKDIKSSTPTSPSE